MTLLTLIYLWYVYVMMIDVLIELITKLLLPPHDLMLFLCHFLLHKCILAGLYQSRSRSDPSPDPRRRRQLTLISSLLDPSSRSPRLKLLILPRYHLTADLPLDLRLHNLQTTTLPILIISPRHHLYLDLKPAGATATVVVLQERSAIIQTF